MKRQRRQMEGGIREGSVGRVRACELLSCVIYTRPRCLMSALAALLATAINSTPRELALSELLFVILEHAVVDI